jgi:acetylornithine deacetylase/succinyl-diaminopimelate desuccinylase-like protein
MAGTREGAVTRIEKEYDSGDFIAMLADRIAIPTESQEVARLPDLHRYLSDNITPYLQPLGYECEIFENSVKNGGPFLVASRIEDPSRPTLLAYGHGDVVRGIPEQWREGLDPWILKQEGDRYYGRGTADNKVQHTIVMAALAAVLAERGSHGFNTKVLLETSEEIGSPGLEEFCSSHKELLAADVLLASDGPRMNPARPDIKLGNRGMLAFDLEIDLRVGSRHSGHWGGVLEDPGVTLAHALACIVTKKGQILVPGWTPDEIPPSIRTALKDCKVDPGDDFPEIDPDWGEPGLSREEKMFAWTSFIILAFITGRPENPVNGVQPDAWARCQLRFSADVDPTNFVPALRRHLGDQGFPQVKVKELPDGFFPASRTNPENPWVGFATESIAKTQGQQPIVVPNSAGGLPSDIFARNLGVPTLWIPHSYTGSCQHGPNEHILHHITREGLRIMTGLYWDLGETDVLG